MPTYKLLVDNRHPEGVIGIYEEGKQPRFQTMWKFLGIDHIDNQEVRV